MGNGCACSEGTASLIGSSQESHRVTLIALYVSSSRGTAPTAYICRSQASVGRSITSRIEMYQDAITAPSLLLSLLRTPTRPPLQPRRLSPPLTRPPRPPR